MSHLAKKAWSELEKQSTNEHMDNSHNLRLKVSFIQRMMDLNIFAHNVYRALEERGLDMLLLVVPCVLVGLFF